MANHRRDSVGDWLFQTSVVTPGKRDKEALLCFKTSPANIYRVLCSSPPVQMRASRKNNLLVEGKKLSSSRWQTSLSNSVDGRRVVASPWWFHHLTGNKRKASRQIYSTFPSPEQDGCLEFTWERWVLPLLLLPLSGLHGAHGQPVQWSVVPREAPLLLGLNNVVLQHHQVVCPEKLRGEFLSGLRPS